MARPTVGPSDAEREGTAVVSHPLGPGNSMEAALVSIMTVATAEMGDRTQLLALVLAARYCRPWPILAGILCATLVNHAAAGVIGASFGEVLTPLYLDGAVGLSMVGMAVWTLKSDRLEEDAATARRAGPFVATLIAFFVAEIGDKTQIATAALAAAYPNLVAVVAGTTCGMLLANVPVVICGKAFADRLPTVSIRCGAAALFAILGTLFIARAAWNAA